MRAVNDLPIGTYVEVDDWGDRRAGEVTEHPEWAVMPGGRKLHPEMIPVRLMGEDRAKLFAAHVVFINN
jgi:hypothetical protein